MKPTLRLLDQTGEEAGTVTGAAVDIGQLEDLVVGLWALETDTAVLDVVIEDSFDGVNWAVWHTFDQVTADMTVPVHQKPDGTRPPAGLVRAVALVGAGGGSFDYTVFLSGNVKQ